ncbi:VWA domain-containing protein [Roseixanthobacter glucoisosaccharinicivorans]|uniref:VWA domain-containing protein n=1 Tax=Roseixanthobacter glucoisosaccharinicivorans TaxID=3119923 RepID=UPI00372CAA26
MNLPSFALPHWLAGLLPAGFHFLRPDWLWAIVPALGLAVLAFRRFGAGGNPWRHLVDAHLLRHLSLQETARGRLWPVLALLLGWVLAALAMAGPTWQKLPTPALDRLDPTVIVLSLGQSMNATDQSPSRLGAARHKVDDILARMRGGQVGLVIYADAPFVASPLTEDGRIIAQMLPELSTELMPVLTDRPDLAVARATALLRDAGAPAGRIVLITDGAGDDPAATLAAAKAAAQAGYRVNVIGVGTLAGSPLLAFDGGVLRARDGTVITTRMDEARLREIAAAGRGSFSAMTVGNGDLDTVLAKSSGSAAPLDPVLQDSGLSADQWLDMGPWLLLGVLALAPLAFRRGWIAVLLVAALGGMLAPRAAQAQGAPAQTLELRGVDTQGQGPQPLAAQGAASGSADAGGSRTWDGLWRTPDQQGADAFARSDYGAAARSFENPQWQASALYKSGAFAEAADAYAKVPDGDYNRGNALARAGKLEEAIKAYDAALAAHPGQDDPVRADAVFNRELVQKLLDQRKKDQEKKDQEKKDKDKKDQQKDQDKKDPKSGNDQKPKDEPGKDEKKDKPQKPGDEKKPDQPPPTPDPKGAPQKPEPQKPEPPKAPPKPDPQKPDPQKPDPQKPEPPKPNPADQKPPEQKPPEKPPEQKPPEPPPPQPPPAQPGAPKPLTEEDQNRAQTLRLVPDDPTGLLRARIRSHYGGAGVVDPQQD